MNNESYENLSFTMTPDEALQNSQKEWCVFSEVFSHELLRLYRPCGGEVRFVVAWKGESDKEETAVLLPNLHFQKD